ncbi:LysR family transcriptional regulator [Arenibaculum pallidiluteum]|uniref:LysR family transcriptional regulator n=1 Tax=Arenibaculum pallidiluteum TaxID=2812559 RepID=UPI001A974801|nr:LysR family transcriptional regulator [Arenibaculum pallidiluteum]
MRSLDPLAGVAVFLHLSELLSFSATAERLGLSRATVSTQVADLERRLGVRLLQRSTRRVTLTEAGQAYRDGLAGLLDQVRDAERLAASFQTEAVGRIRVTAPVEFGHRFLVPALPDFLATRPGLVVELDLSNRPADLIATGFDLAIRGTIDVDPNLIVRRLGTSPVHLAAAPTYLAARGMPDRPEELEAHDCLHFAGLRWGRSWLLCRDGAEHRQPIRPKIEINDGEALRQAALGGLGITLLPAFLIGDDLRAGRLRPVLADWTVPPVPVNAVYPANRAIAAKVRAFVGFFAARLAQVPDLRG